MKLEDMNPNVSGYSSLPQLNLRGLRVFTADSDLSTERRDALLYHLTKLLDEENKFPPISCIELQALEGAGMIVIHFRHGLTKLYRLEWDQN